MSQKAEDIVVQMFKKLGHFSPSPEVVKMMQSVIDGLINRMQGKYLFCSQEEIARLRVAMVGVFVQGFLFGMVPKNVPACDAAGAAIRVAVRDQHFVPVRVLHMLEYRQFPDGAETLTVHVEPNRIAAADDALLKDVLSRLWPGNEDPLT